MTFDVFEGFDKFAGFEPRQFLNTCLVIILPDKVGQMIPMPVEIICQVLNEELLLERHPSRRYPVTLVPDQIIHELPEATFIEIFCAGYSRDILQNNAVVLVQERRLFFDDVDDG